MRRFVIASAVLLTAFAAAEGLAQMQPGMMMGNGNFARHHLAMGQGLPAPYANLSGPVAASHPVLMAGSAVYAEHCAVCHGPTGQGDGEGAKDLQPPVPRLTGMQAQHLYNDGFLAWTIAEGGEALGSAMPAFKEVLTPEQFWQVIRYVQAGLPRP